MKYTLTTSEDVACIVELSCATVLRGFVCNSEIPWDCIMVLNGNSFGPAKLDTSKNKALACQTPPICKATQNLWPYPTFLPNSFHLHDSFNVCLMNMDLNSFPFIGDCS